MCTAATYKTKDFYFGRTLDYEFSYGEEVVITPVSYTHLRTLCLHTIRTRVSGAVARMLEPIVTGLSRAGALVTVVPVDATSTRNLLNIGRYCHESRRRIPSRSRARNRRCKFHVSRDPAIHPFLNSVLN